MEKKKKTNLHFTGCCPESTSVLFRKGSLFICKLHGCRIFFLNTSNARSCIGQIELPCKAETTVLAINSALLVGQSEMAILENKRTVLQQDCNTENWITSLIGTTWETLRNTL